MVHIIHFVKNEITMLYIHKFYCIYNRSIVIYNPDNPQGKCGHFLLFSIQCPSLHGIHKTLWQKTNNYLVGIYIYIFNTLKLTEIQNIISIQTWNIIVICRTISTYMNLCRKTLSLKLKNPNRSINAIILCFRKVLTAYITLKL